MDTAGTAVIDTRRDRRIIVTAAAGRRATASGTSERAAGFRAESCRGTIERPQQGLRTATGMGSTGTAAVDAAGGDRGPIIAAAAGCRATAASPGERSACA
jgi:hypothetical protein